MTTFIVLAIIAIAIIYFVFFRKKEDPKPTETLYLNRPLPRATPTVRKPVKFTPPPRSPIKAASGHTYVPNDDGTYRNTTDNSVVTWLMLYLLLSDSARADYPEPSNYMEGMTFDDARRESAEELLAHSFDEPEPPASTVTTDYTPDPTPSMTPEPSSDDHHRPDPTPSYTPDPSPSYSPDPTPSYSSDSTSSFSSDF
ncbi:MAG: hypothetical protein DI628_00870 [Blastochloris viridis]|uniref:Uncharacterized protein n=1 Tax=Blastochloris viridis TaxID=1079 RepID=A0A6N4R1W7_BLAVI|nr:MAG: hypothetical protein DI628_00870 [Blastochloris viridis]